jgi:hypothetical protein
VDLNKAKVVYNRPTPTKMITSRLSDDLWALWLALAIFFSRFSDLCEPLKKIYCSGCRVLLFRCSWQSHSRDSGTQVQKSSAEVLRSKPRIGPSMWCFTNRARSKSLTEWTTNSICYQSFHWCWNL